MEIEAGEFVRTYVGEIGKCVDKSFKSCVVDFNKEEYEEFFEDEYEEEIVKHSKNLIDLIKEGDYVNGYKTIELKKSNIKDDGICILVYRNHQYEQWETIFENEIETILTHEQYEQKCFRVEE